jgi:pilus assembly protein Flp/PilA
MGYTPSEPANVNEGSFILTFIRFVRDDRAATAIEYGLIAAGIAVAIIAVAIIVAVTSTASTLNTTFTSVQTALK